MNYLAICFLILCAGCRPQSDASEDTTTGAVAEPCTGTQECDDNAALGCIEEHTSICEYQYRCALSDLWVVEQEWGYSDEATCTEVLTGNNCGDVEAEILDGTERFHNDKHETCVSRLESMDCVADLAGLLSAGVVYECDDAIQTVEPAP